MVNFLAIAIPSVLHGVGRKRRQKGLWGGQALPRGRGYSSVAGSWLLRAATTAGVSTIPMKRRARMKSSICSHFPRRSGLPRDDSSYATDGVARIPQEHPRGNHKVNLSPDQVIESFLPGASVPPNPREFLPANAATLPRPQGPRKRGKPRRASHTATLLGQRGLPAKRSTGSLVAFLLRSPGSRRAQPQARRLKTPDDREDSDSRVFHLFSKIKSHRDRAAAGNTKGPPTFHSPV